MTLLPILSLFLCVVQTAHALPAPILITSDDQLLSSYDYVVVGGGTSGLTVADRLSEDPDVTVLTIEPGPLLSREEEFRDILVPNTNTRTNNTSMASSYTFPNIVAEPLTELNNRQPRVTAARLFGGASGINGLGWGRMGKSDHNDWAEFTGDDGWNWENMVKYYKRVETFVPPPPEWGGVTSGDECCRGEDGPIQAGYGRFWYKSNVQNLEAEKELGIPYKKDDGNGDNMGGVWCPSSIKTKHQEYERSYSKEGHYDPNKDRKNWHVLVETSATRILFDKKRAVGVEYSQGAAGKKKTAKVNKEVVMAAGAVHSAPLLQISGVGPKAVIEDIDVPLVADLPLIGEGLQDHAFSFVAYRRTWPEGFEEEKWLSQNNRTFLDDQWERYLHNRTGVYTTVWSHRVMLLSFPFINPNYTEPLEAEIANSFDQFLRDGVPEEYKALYKQQREILLRTHANPEAPADEAASGALALLLRPLSRGYIRARTSSIFDPIKMDWRTFTNPFDIQVLLASVRFSRRYFETEALKGFSLVETAPGAALQSDEQLIQWLRQNTSPSNAHTCCTLSLGAASDSRARLKGVEGVRIADASVWPFVPGAHATQQTAYVVAEKVADLIKEDARLGS